MSKDEEVVRSFDVPIPENLKGLYDALEEKPKTLFEYTEGARPITKEDCFCPIKGDGSSIIRHFENNFDKFDFKGHIPGCNIWRDYQYDPKTQNELIEDNKVLSEIHKIIPISHLIIIEASRNSFLHWHYDFPRKGPALNMLLTPYARSHSLFTYNFLDTSGLVECEYKPNEFVLYNTMLVHCILNFETPRYVFSACFERGKTDLEWEEAKELLSSFIE